MVSSKDVSESVFSFRESVRHVWNTYFQGMDDVMGPDVQDAFSLVEDGLFQGLVVSACGVSSCVKYRMQPTPFLAVVPRAEIDALSLQLGQADNGSFGWDAPAACPVDPGMRLEFVRFFDWNPYEQISMSLIEVHVAQFDSRPDLVGRRALVPDYEIRFLSFS
jgi:hypothetical protein